MGGPDTVGRQPRNLATLAKRAVSRRGQSLETADDSFSDTACDASARHTILHIRLCESFLAQSMAR